MESDMGVDTTAHALPQDIIIPLRLAFSISEYIYPIVIQQRGFFDCRENTGY